MLGDVWLSGGQSTTGVPLYFALNGADAVKASDGEASREFGSAALHSCRYGDYIDGAQGWRALATVHSAASPRMLIFAGSVPNTEG
jgi:hypothetical protein